METDASDVGLGAILTQQGRVIEYASRVLTATEKNYSATEKECLGVVWALEKFAMYLEGFHFKVITDHKPLTYLMQLKEPRGKLARWRVALDNFDFQIQHRPGRLMAVADALSRAPVSAITLEGLWSETALNALQQSDQDVQTMYRWVETRVKPKEIKHHVNSFLRTNGDKLRINNGLLVLVVKCNIELCFPRVWQRKSSEFFMTIRDILDQRK